MLFNSMSVNRKSLLFKGDAITNMIGQVTEIAGRAKQAFVVGQGLSPEGAKLLGKKLACMTIGDLEGLLELKNIDPFKVAELLGHLKDLAKALVGLLLRPFSTQLFITTNRKLFMKI
jgi:hypothetical protein